MADESREIKRLKHLAAHVTPQSHYGKPNLAQGLNNEIQIRYIYEKGLYVFVKFDGRWYAQKFQDFYSNDAQTLQEQIKAHTDVYEKIETGPGSRPRGLWNKAYTAYVVYVNDSGDMTCSGAIVLGDANTGGEGSIWYDTSLNQFFCDNGTTQRRICDFIQEGTDTVASGNAATLMPNDGDVYIEIDAQPPKLTIRRSSLIYNQLRATSSVWNTLDYTPQPNAPECKDITICNSSTLSTTMPSRREYGSTGNVYVRADYKDVNGAIDNGTPTVTLSKSWTSNVTDDLDQSSSTTAGSSSTNNNRTTSPAIITTVNGHTFDSFISANWNVNGCTEDDGLGSQTAVTDAAGYHTVYFQGYQMWGKVAGTSTSALTTFLNGCGYVQYPANNTISSDYGSGIGLKTFPSTTSATGYRTSFPAGSADRINIGVTAGTFPALAYPSSAGSLTDIYDDLGNNIYNSTSNTSGFTVSTATYTGINSATTTMKIYRSNSVAGATSTITWYINNPGGS